MRAFPLRIEYIFVIEVIGQTSNQPVKLRHRTSLDGVHDVDVGFHGLVVGVPEAGEASEEEDVPDGIQVGLGLGEFQVSDTGDLIFGKIDDLALCHLQGRVELLIVQVGVVAPVGCPDTNECAFLMDISQFQSIEARKPGELADQLELARRNNRGQTDICFRQPHLDFSRPCALARE